jgi:hypothetical protein
MARVGVAADAAVYATLIGICAREAAAPRAVSVFQAMRVAGVAPNGVTHALMATVGQRGANDVAAAQSRLAAVSAAAAALAAALIQKGLL